MVEKPTKAAQMCLLLPATFRWAVSGTPIQKNIEDLYQLFLFLQYFPFADHRWWNALIEKPLMDGSKVAEKRIETLLKNTSWRSTKVQVSQEIDIPNQQTKIVNLNFSPAEHFFYSKIHKQTLEDITVRCPIFLTWSENFPKVQDSRL
jgi:E3 ubiquitin-protein ligase SHPRH